MTEPTISHPFPQTELQPLLEQLLADAKRRGMDAAEANVAIESGFSVTARQRDVETLEHHQEKALQVVVYHQNRSATVRTGDLSSQAVVAALDKACSLVQYTHQDPCMGLADPEQMAYGYPDLQLYHPWEITPAQAIDQAILCEQFALDYDPRITHTEGVSISSYVSFQVYGNTHGFIGAYPSSYHTIDCSVVAKEGDRMQRDFEYTAARRPQDLDDISVVARQAAAKTLRRLPTQRLTTRRCPVIFHASVAKTLLRHLIGAISGANIYKQASFMTNQLGKAIFPPHVHIYQRPHLIAALGSAAFDSEGVVTTDIDYVRDGILQSYVLGSYSARKLGLVNTGNSGGVFNLTIAPGPDHLTALLRQMDSGLFVTELLGQGVNLVTGDYSRGAAGFWVEGGELQYPVEEITIAASLPDLFARLVTVANDVDARGAIRTGSILIEEMTIAGA